MTKRQDSLEALDKALASVPEVSVPAGLADRITATALALPQDAPEHGEAGPSDGRSVFKWGAGITAIAASLAAAFLILTQLTLGPQLEVMTANGEQRTIALEDGSSITLNGGTHLQLEEGRERFARLIEGEAMFRIVHDETRPFIVETANYRLVDKGTAFNVDSSRESVEVAVSEGLVEVELQEGEHLLEPGDALELAQNAVARKTTVDPADIGRWTTGQLVFELASLREVAQDLTRATGQPIALDSALDERRFSGVIAVETADDALAQTLAELLDVKVIQGDPAWTFAAAE